MNYALPWHVYPADDWKPHITDGSKECWCKPHHDEECNTFIHNSMDGREQYDSGILQYN